MFCSRCGAQNADTANFCHSCGNVLNSFQNYEKNDTKNNTRSSTKKIYYIIGAIVIVIAFIGAILLGIRGKKAKEYETYLASAEKYIEELNYEQAKDFYLKAIEVSPKQLEPYVKLAQVYVVEGDVEKAEKILEMAEVQNAKGDEEIKAELEVITTKIRGAYAAYADKIMEYEELYGAAEITWELDWYTYLDGLCFMKLIDFDNNGQEELLLVYQKSVSDEYGTYRDYTFEIWGYEKDEIVLLDSGDLFGTDGGVTHIYLTEVDGYTYLVSGGTDGFGYYYYHGYSERGFGTVRKEEWDFNEDGEEIWTIDGREVSVEEFDKEHEKWFSNYVEYLMVAYDTNYNYELELKQSEETKRILALYFASEDETEQQNDDARNPLTEDEIYEKLVAHYKKGTEDCPGDEMTVMEGGFDNENVYGTTVRCGVPGNPTATQMLYDVTVDAQTGEVTQVRTLTDNQVVRFNLYDEEVEEDKGEDEFITEAQAREYAAKYWDYEEGDVDENTGYPLTLEVQDGPTENSPYYQITLRWLVDNSHWSTIDLINVNAYTGECTYPF